jgi:Flagellar biosynthesis pathway, component FliR
MFSVPVFSSQIIFPIMRASIALAVSLAIYSGVKTKFELPQNLAEIMVGILSELFFSFLVFFIIRIFLLSPQLSGETVGYQAGYGLMTLVSPFEENPFSVITELIFPCCDNSVFCFRYTYWFFVGDKKKF